MISGIEDMSASGGIEDIYNSFEEMNNDFEEWKNKCVQLHEDGLKDILNLIKKSKIGKRSKKRKIESEFSKVMQPIKEGKPLEKIDPITTPVVTADVEEKIPEVQNESCVRRSKRAAAKKATEKNATALKISLSSKLRRPTEVPQSNKNQTDDHAEEKDSATFSSKLSSENSNTQKNNSSQKITDKEKKNRSSDYMSANDVTSGTERIEISSEKLPAEKCPQPDKTCTEPSVKPTVLNCEPIRTDAECVDEIKAKVPPSPVNKKMKSVEMIHKVSKISVPIVVINDSPMIEFKSPSDGCTELRPSERTGTKKVDEKDSNVLNTLNGMVSPSLSQTRVISNAIPLDIDELLDSARCTMRTRSMKLVHANDLSSSQPKEHSVTIANQQSTPFSSDGPILKNSVKRMVKTVEENIMANSTKPLDLLKNKLMLNVNVGKENSKIKYGCPYEKNRKVTPLATNNRIVGANSATKPCSNVSKEQLLKEVEELEKKRKEEEQVYKLKKKEEAFKKREERIKINQEKLRKQREEKMQKVCRTREAAEREKFEQLSKLEKEKEARDQAIKAEMQRLKEERILKKKMFNQLKAQEAEERRQKEETARLAKLKEAEEEQRLLLETKMKQQEEAEKRFQQQQAEEQKEKEALKASKGKPVLKVLSTQTYEMTPPRSEREPLPLENPDDYGIDEIAPGDSSDDENHPKKQIPLWAQKSARMKHLKIQSYVSAELMDSFFKPPHNTPDLSKVFGTSTKRLRTSSAVWTVSPVDES